MSHLEVARRRVLLSDVVRMVINLGLVPTAQGIEDPEQGEYLRPLGFVRGQGYAFVAPMAAPEIEKLLGRPNAQPTADLDLASGVDLTSSVREE
jgi:EAL domain-containing protein (putative c-di-GMP-specific phosphodiesterase class I)